MRPVSALLMCLSLPWLAHTQIAGAGIRGFLSRDVAGEAKLEQQAQSIPDPARLRKYLDYLAGQPHNAGSARSKAIAQYLSNMLREWGLDAYVEQFEALMPYPTVREVEVLGPKRYTLELKEPVIPQDPDSGDAHQMPTYNAYGATGNVTGEVVYANFGVPDDYDWLAKRGISVKGKIVITRYGKSWRGIKPKVAAEHGAIACLIYSDPHEDGYFEGDTYAKGPMRPMQGVQRGSVLDMPLYPGDPLSPGWASEKGARKLSLAEAKTLMKIPVMPLSFGDAQPILEQLTGPVVPREWRGSLPITYHAGPGGTQVHIRTDYDWTTKPLYDVIATIPGSDAPDRWVMAGNHHDAWVNGADDPVSGAVALLETARTLATLKKQGWVPKRTIKLAFWDGEEFGLLGSTEWAEKHQIELKEKAIAYLNSDSSGKGWIHISGSHTLEAFAAEVASSVTQPGGGTTLLEASLRHPSAPDGEDESTTAGKGEKPFQIGALGAGSDYVAFLDYLGVASMNQGFGGEAKSGIYHSVYDSIYWYTHFSDGTFVDGQALAQYTAIALLRLADSSVLPLEFVRFANTVIGYMDDIGKQAQKDGQTLDLEALHQQANNLKESGERYNSLLESVMKKSTLDASREKSLNQMLMRTERVLTRPEGLPNRPWYKHQIYAPGFYTGYGVKTIPGVREAVDSKDWRLAQREAQIVEQCLAQMTQTVNEAIGELSGM